MAGRRFLQAASVSAQHVSESQIHRDKQEAVAKGKETL